MFKTNDEGHGFQISFANGYTVSVQFHRWAYSHNHKAFDGFEVPTESPNAEVALIHPDGWLKDLSSEFDWWDGDSVNGWTTPDEVAELIAYAVALPKK